MAQKNASDTRTGCIGLIVIVVIAIIIAVATTGGGSKSGSGSSSGSTQAEARAYIHEKAHTINFGRVDYEHVKALVALLTNAGTEGEDTEVLNEVAKVAQEAHDDIDNFRQELFKSGEGKLSDATLQLSEGANELKNAMGALVAYTGNPNPATLAHFSTQLDAAKAKWNQGVDEIWEIAGEHGAYRLK